MSKFSWFTSTERKDGGWYKCNARVELSSNTLSFTDYPFYKPNRKGGYNRKEAHLFNIECKKVYGHLWPIVKKELKHISFNPKQKLRKRRFLKIGSVLELVGDLIV